MSNGMGFGAGGGAGGSAQAIAEGAVQVANQIGELVSNKNKYKAAIENIKAKRVQALTAAVQESYRRQEEALQKKLSEIDYLIAQCQEVQKMKLEREQKVSDLRYKQQVNAMNAQAVAEREKKDKKEKRKTIIIGCTVVAVAIGLIVAKAIKG